MIIRLVIKMKITRNVLMQNLNAISTKNFYQMQRAKDAQKDKSETRTSMQSAKYPNVVRDRLSQTVERVKIAHNTKSQ